MSGLAATMPVRPARESARRVEESERTALALRAVAFAGLCAFASLHWGKLVSPSPDGRVLLVAAVLTAGGAAMGLSRDAVLPVRVLIALVTFFAALLAVGLPARFLPPGNWGDLGDGVNRGLVGTSTISWPYTAGDPWIRLSILLGLPTVGTLAAVAAFAPRGRRSGEAGRALGLVLLIGLYAFAATEVSLGSHALRGLVLLVLIGAWLWLPRMRRRDAVAATAAVAAAGLLALPLSHSLDTAEPWVHWQQWSWFSSAAGEGFQWDHQYGPLSWPRTGKTLLDVKSPRPNYWKAETLDRFDGYRWVHSGAFANSDVRSALPERLNPKWVEKITVADRDLRTGVVIGAGTVFQYDGTHSVNTTSDGTTTVVDGSIGKGESYDVHAYVPDPSAAQLRATPLDTREELSPYLEIDLPSATLRQVPQVVTMPPWNEPAGSGTSFVLSSPYRRAYLLAHSLAAGQPTIYDVVKRTQTYLENRYSYSEQPPVRTYPLEAFLFKDKAGYCQQFSGAMALMLRMDGIPARVAGGFAPGEYDAGTHEYHVRDLDAHSWVEVWFRGIGWVPFDPTPPVAPASLQSAGVGLPSAGSGDTHNKGSSPSSERPQHLEPSASASPAAGSSGLAVALGVAVALGALAVTSVWLLAAVRVRRLRRNNDEPELAELAAALTILGYRVAPGTTLAQLERRLRAVADERAGRYVRVLRDHRFGPGGRRRPTHAERRELRSSLIAGRGLRGRLRGYLALPPSRPRFRAS